MMVKSPLVDSKLVTPILCQLNIFFLKAIPILAELAGLCLNQSSRNQTALLFLPKMTQNEWPKMYFKHNFQKFDIFRESYYNDDLRLPSSSWVVNSDQGNLRRALSSPPTCQARRKIYFMIIQVYFLHPSLSITHHPTMQLVQWQETGFYSTFLALNNNKSIQFQNLEVTIF